MMASLPNVGSLQRLLLRGTMERTRSLVSYSWIRRIERVPHEAIWPALRAHDVGGGGVEELVNSARLLYTSVKSFVLTPHDRLLSSL